MSWDERVKEALKIQRFTDEDRTLAENFNTCPVGMLRRHDDIDSQAYKLFEELSMAFHYAVLRDETQIAAYIYDAINAAGCAIPNKL